MYFWEQPPLWLQVLGVVGPLAGAVVAFLVDKRTGHGYGLVLLTIAAGAVAVGATLTTQEVQQASIGRESLGPGVLMIFVLF